MRILLAVLVAAVAAIGMLPPEVGRAQDAAYRLVADWPTLPEGVFFGQQRGWPDQAARDAAAAARRAAGGGPGGPGGARPTAPPIYGQGISGIAIDGDDHIYVFNRGEQTVMVFDRDGKLVRAGAERDMHGERVAGGWLHSGEVDWDGNVWVVERMNHRIIKFDPTLERALMQIGVTGEPGNDATHLNSPSGILFTREGNIVVTDGYGNNRVALYGPDGTFIKQVGRGRGGPDDKGAGPGEWDLPHQGAVDADDNLYLVDRENRRIQVLRQPAQLRPRVRQRGLEPLGHRHLAPRRRRLRLHRRPRRRARPQDRPRRRPHPRHLGRARPRPRPVRLGPRHGRRHAGRGLRGRHLRPAGAEVRAGGAVALRAEFVAQLLEHATTGFALYCKSALDHATACVVDPAVVRQELQPDICLVWPRSWKYSITISHLKGLDVKSSNGTMPGAPPGSGFCSAGHRARSAIRLPRSRD